MCARRESRKPTMTTLPSRDQSIMKSNPSAIFPSSSVVCYATQRSSVLPLLVRSRDSWQCLLQRFCQNTFRIFMTSQHPRLQPMLVSWIVQIRYTEYIYNYNYSIDQHDISISVLSELSGLMGFIIIVCLVLRDNWVMIIGFKNRVQRIASFITIERLQ